MKTLSDILPSHGIVGGTRALAAGSVALLVADRLNRTQRKKVGWTLLGLGLAMSVGCFGVTQAHAR